MDVRSIAYQRLLCMQFGGGLYKIETPGGLSCAVTERAPDGELVIKELLSPDGCGEEALSAIAAVFPASEYVTRTPVRQKEEHDNAQRFGMMASPGDLSDAIDKTTALPWYGLAFD